MAWTPREVKDQIVEFPNRFKIDEVPHIIEPDFGTVVEPGTPINKAYLQPIEDYLAQVETKDEVQARIDALAGQGNTKTVKQLEDELAAHKADDTIHLQAGERDAWTNDRVKGSVRLTVSDTEPSNPNVNDIWIDISE